jgi:hypothetical protein
MWIIVIFSLTLNELVYERVEIQKIICNKYGYCCYSSYIHKKSFHSHVILYEIVEPRTRLIKAEIVNFYFSYLNCSIKKIGQLAITIAMMNSTIIIILVFRSFSYFNNKSHLIHVFMLMGINVSFIQIIHSNTIF